MTDRLLILLDPDQQQRVSGAGLALCPTTITLPRAAEGFIFSKRERWRVGKVLGMTRWMTEPTDQPHLLLAEPLEPAGSIRAHWQPDQELADYLTTVSRIIGQRVIVVSDPDFARPPGQTEGTVWLRLWSPETTNDGREETLSAIGNFPVRQKVCFDRPAYYWLSDKPRAYLVDRRLREAYAVLDKHTIVTFFPLWDMSDRLRLSLIAALLTTALTDYRFGQSSAMFDQLFALAEPYRLFLTARAMVVERQKLSVKRADQLRSEERQLQLEEAGITAKLLRARRRLARADRMVRARYVSLRSLRREARRQCQQIMADSRIRLVILKQRELIWITKVFPTDPLPDQTVRWLGPYCVMVDLTTGSVQLKLLRWFDSDREPPELPHPCCRSDDTLSFKHLTIPLSEALAAQAIDRVVRLVMEYLAMVDPQDSELILGLQVWPQGGQGE